MAKSFQDAVAQAKKALGSDAKITASDSALDTSKSKMDAAQTKANSAKDGYAKALQDLNKAQSAYLDNLKKTSKQVEADKFGLNSKDPDYNKKRDTAQKGFDSFFAAEVKDVLASMADNEDMTKALARS